LAGSVVVVVLEGLGQGTLVLVLVVALAGAGVCLAWRLLALRMHWCAPMPTGPANV
jgi:hypothetical protein